MNVKIFAICDTEKRYAIKLMEAFCEKKNLGFQVHAFSETEEFQRFAKQTQIEILLISGKIMSETISRLNIGKIILLSDGEVYEAFSDYESIYKYQSAEHIMKEVLCYYAEYARPVTGMYYGKQEFEVYGIYSPIGRCGKSALAENLAENYGKVKKTLLLDLQSFSARKEQLSEEELWDLADMIYFLRQGKKTFLYKLSSIVRSKEIVENRALQGKGCPYCAGRLPTETNNLQILYPEIASEFDLEANYPLTPDKVTPGSGRKVIWKCEHGHQYVAAINNRTRLGRGCPYCAGRLPTETNNLQVLYPEIASEFDLEANYPLTPTQCAPKSHKKVTWRCEHGHQYVAAINNRTRFGRGCPYCAGRLPTETNNLQVLYPEIASEFDLEANYPLTPDKISPKSSRKVIWKCENGHRYAAKVYNRTKNKSGCPLCEGRLPIPYETSFDFMFPEIAAEWDYEKNYPLKPQDFTAYSSKLVWWKCKCGNQWRATIRNRTNGSNCPKCFGEIYITKGGNF